MDDRFRFIKDTAYGFTWEYANIHENPELLEEEK